MKILKGESGTEYRVLFSFNAFVKFEEVTRINLDRLGEIPGSPKLLLQFFRFAWEAGEGKKIKEGQASEAIGDIVKEMGYATFATELMEAFIAVFKIETDAQTDETTTGNES